MTNNNPTTTTRGTTLMSKIPGTANDLRVPIKLIRFSVSAIAAMWITYVILWNFTQLYQAASTATQQEVAGLLNAPWQWLVAAVLTLTAAGAGLLIYRTIGAFWSTTSFVVRTVRTRGATQ